MTLLTYYFYLKSLHIYRYDNMYYILHSCVNAHHKHICEHWETPELNSVSNVTVYRQTAGQPSRKHTELWQLSHLCAVLLFCEVKPSESRGEGREAQMKVRLLRLKGQMDQLTFLDQGSDYRLSSEPGSCCGWRGCWPFPWTSPRSSGSTLDSNKCKQL